MALLSHNIFGLLVITVIFGTVALVNVQKTFAADSVVIQNSVQSATHTGGQSSSGGESGQNGLDGSDGQSSQNGRDGAQGANGADGGVTDGERSTYTRVESFINGERAEYQNDTSTGSISHATTATQFHATSGAVETLETVDARKKTLIEKLEALRLILSNYVSLLF